MSDHRDCATVARLLLDNGADVDATDCGGETPLQIAAAHIRDAIEDDRHRAIPPHVLELLALLLDRGADPHAIVGDYEWSRRSPAADVLTACCKMLPRSSPLHAIVRKHL